MMPFVASGMLTGENQVPTPVMTNTTGAFYIAVGKDMAAWALATM